EGQVIRSRTSGSYRIAGGDGCEHGSRPECLDLHRVPRRAGIIPPERLGGARLPVLTAIGGDYGDRGCNREGPLAGITVRRVGIAGDPDVVISRERGIVGERERVRSGSP